jgi:ethanolamine utilization protein EutN
MFMGRVVVDVVATQKHSSHKGQKILYIQLLNLESDQWDPILDLDAADAGVGD